MLTSAAALIVIQHKVKPETASLTGPLTIKKMKAAVRAGSPVTGTMVTKGPRGQDVATEFAIMYPGMMSQKMQFFGMKNETYLNKTGFYGYNPAKNEYTRLNMFPSAEIGNMGMYGMDSMFGDKESFKVADRVTKTTFQRRAAFAVSITLSPSLGQNVARGDTIFVDAKTFLPLGFDEDDPSAGGVDHTTYQNMKWNARLTKKDFEWNPPKGAKLISH